MPIQKKIRIPFKIINNPLDIVSLKNNPTLSRFGYFYWVNQNFPFTNSFAFFLN